MKRRLPYLRGVLLTCSEGGAEGRAKFVDVDMGYSGDGATGNRLEMKEREARGEGVKRGLKRLRASIVQRTIMNGQRGFALKSQIMLSTGDIGFFLLKIATS